MYKLLLLLFSFVVLTVSGYELTVLHINDIHVRFEETDTYSGTCKKSGPNDTKTACFGGLARVQQTVKTIQAREPNSIFLNGGDFYQGTSWYTLFKWNVVLPFANKLNFTAMSPGNHEFDDGVDGYVPFLKSVTFPVICANTAYENEPKLKDLIKPSIVVERGGKKIGIIGYLTPETEDLASPGNVTFLDEIETISAEAKRLKGQGVNILIALGHSGYDIDLKIAEKVPDIDIVVGGHSHSFLYTGSAPSTEQPVGDYPTLVTQSNGRVVPVVQAYAFTKYLGYFKAIFNDTTDELISWQGSTPLLLNSSYPEDPEILADLIPWQDQLVNYTKTVIGETKVLLSPSRNKESNLGDFITDAMVDWYKSKPQYHLGAKLGTSMALLNSGGIRGSFDVGNITLNDLLTVLPFSNSIDLVSLNGSTIWDAFEFSSSKLRPDGVGTAGAFLQVSGFKVTIDLRREPGHRVTKLLVRCESCSDSEFEPIDVKKVYHVVMAGYLANGGDGFKMISEQKLEHLVGAEEIPVFRAFLDKRSPVVQEVDGRIEIITNEDTSSSWSLKSSVITNVLIQFMLITLKNSLS